MYRLDRGSRFCPQGRTDGRILMALADLDTGNPHWLNAVMFAIAAVIAIVLTWWFFGNDR